MFLKNYPVEYIVVFQKTTTLAVVFSIYRSVYQRILGRSSTRLSALESMSSQYISRQIHSRETLDAQHLFHQQQKGLNSRFSLYQRISHDISQWYIMGQLQGKTHGPLRYESSAISHGRPIMHAHF